jgi:membrane-associated phospholipid phosphatase
MSSDDAAQEVIDHLKLFYRTFDISLLTVSIFESFFLRDPRGIAVATFIILSILTNHLLKEIFKAIMGVATYPILGSGLRPKEAEQCSYFDENDRPKTYGMPSGHSQTFTMIATMLGMGIWERNKKDPDPWLYWRIGFLVLLAFGALYARVVWQKCHTWAQAIVGAIAGIGLAYLFSRYITNPFVHDKKYYEKRLKKRRRSAWKKHN